MIVPLNLPPAKLDLKRKDETIYVRCILRNKDLVCTPEEWVRQHLIHYLISLGLAKSRLASEVSVEYNGMNKRADIVYYNSKFDPILIVECKAPEVKIDDSVLQQAARYNHSLNVEYLLLSNGMEHLIGQIDKSTGSITYLDDLSDLI